MPAMTSEMPQRLRKIAANTTPHTPPQKVIDQIEGMPNGLVAWVE